MKIETIMLVDDNETDQFLHEVIFEKFDSDVKLIKAYDGREALEKLAEIDGSVDAIFLDINMPGMNGFDFLQEYDESPYPSVAVIMLSSSGRESDIEKAMSYKFVKSYISKPLEVDDLELLNAL